MARAAPTFKATKLAATAHKSGRSVLAVSKKAAKLAKAAVAEPAVVTKAKPAVTAKPATDRPQAIAPVAAPARAPKLSKDELRAQVAKLEEANAKLRAKSRETNKAAKLAARQIAELEAQVAQFESDAEARGTGIVTQAEPKTAERSRKPRQPRRIDPGDAVPSGVVVIDPAPMDEEAKTALDNLEHNLGGE